MAHARIRNCRQTPALSHVSHLIFSSQLSRVRLRLHPSRHCISSSRSSLMQSSDQNRPSGEAPTASRPQDAAGPSAVSAPAAQHSPSPSQISLPASTSTWSAPAADDYDGGQAGTRNYDEENDLVQLAISPSEPTQTNRRSLRIANPFADLEKPPEGNDPQPGGHGRDGTVSAVPQPEAKPSASDIPYYMRLKAGRNYIGWFLRDMLVEEEYASPIAEKLAKPTLPTRVAVVDWENLQTAPQSEVFRVGNSKRDDQLAELVGGLPNLPQTKVTRDPTGEQLRESLRRKSDGTRLIIVEDLSRDVVGVLGTEYDLDYEFFEEHICPKSDTPEPLAGAHLPKPYVHLRWYHPIRMNRQEAQRLGCFRQGDEYASGWSLVNSAFERQSWDLPTHQPIKQISTFKGDDGRNLSILSSLSASNQYPKYSSRNGTREEQISVYFVPPSTEEGKPSTSEFGRKCLTRVCLTESLTLWLSVIILVDPVLLFAIAGFTPSKTYSDKRPATASAIPSPTATLLLDTFREMAWPDDCGTYVLHQTLVSIITDLIRNDAITAIIDMKNEMKAINTERRDLHAIENTIDLWDKTLSGIQEQLSVYRRAVKTIFATHTALLWSEESSTATSLLFRRGLFTDFGEDMEANRYSKDLLKIIDESLSQATETFNTLRTTLSIYESQQAIAQASAINRLTEMVFIFIPLSFSTSIFGMQMKVRFKLDTVHRSC